MIKKTFTFIVKIITSFPKYLILGIQCIIDKDKRKELDLENDLIQTVITSLSLITYLISIFLLTRWYVQSERTKKFSKGLAEQTEIIVMEENKINNENATDNYEEIKNKTNSNYNNEPDLSYLKINFNYYKNKNNETVGWIKVNGTNINYPIVKSKDNKYYLEHDFYKRKSETGWIFLDYRNDMENISNNTIIYGHNLINRTMFGYLPKMMNPNWFKNENNKFIKIATPNYNTIWQIFSIYKIEPTTDYLKTKFNSSQDYQEFLNKIKNRSIFNFSNEITYEDKIITLSTCDDTGTKRIVVHAKLYSIE